MKRNFSSYAQGLEVGELKKIYSSPEVINQGYKVRKHQELALLAWLRGGKIQQVCNEGRNAFLLNAFEEKMEEGIITLQAYNELVRYFDNQAQPKKVIAFSKYDGRNLNKLALGLLESKNGYYKPRAWAIALKEFYGAENIANILVSSSADLAKKLTILERQFTQKVGDSCKIQEWVIVLSNFFADSNKLSNIL